MPYRDKQVMHLQADTGELQKDIGFAARTSFEEGISRIIQTLD